MSDPIPWRILRYLFAAYYLLIGGAVALSLLGVIPAMHPKVSAASAAFQGAMLATGFMFPMLALTYIVSACALFFYRTAPLGTVIIAPVVVIIFLTDTLLDTHWIMGSLNVVILAALAWHLRSAYAPLWSHPRA